jgi:hypothetical protein
MKTVSRDLKVLMEVDMTDIWVMGSPSRHLAFGTMTFNLVTFIWDFDLLWDNFSQGYIFLKKKVNRVLIFCIVMPPEKSFHLIAFFYHVILIMNFDLFLEMLTLEELHFLGSYVVCWQLLFWHGNELVLLCTYLNRLKLLG